MLNTNGILAVMDRGLTINWDDGPTLHRILAQVRYHTADSTAAQMLRIFAAQRYSDDPLTFVYGDHVVQVTWIWKEHRDSALDTPIGWTAQLSVTNITAEDIYLDALDVIRVESAFNGLFTLGAPPGLWQCAREGSADKIAWETWSETAGSADGFTRTAEMLVQPAVSNRSRPPAVLIKAIGTPVMLVEMGAENTQALVRRTTVLPVEIKLVVTGEKFDRLTAGCRADGTLLAAHVTMTSTEFWIASGYDAQELRDRAVPADDDMATEASDE